MTDVVPTPAGTTVLEWCRHLARAEHRPEYRSKKRPEGLTGTDVGVGLVLATYCDYDGTGAWPSIDTLAEASGRARSTVIDSLAALTEAGAIQVLERGRRSSHGYELVAPAEWSRGATTEWSAGATTQAPSGSPTDASGSPTDASGSEGLPNLLPNLVSTSSSPQPPAEPSAAATPAAGGGGDQSQDETSPALARAVELVTAVLGVRRLADRASSAIATRIAEGWTPAQVVTVLEEPPDQLRRPSGFVIARLEETTGPPEVPARPPAQLQRDVQPGDGWPRLAVVDDPPCDLCGRPMSIVGDQGWCDEHEWRPLTLPAAAS